MRKCILFSVLICGALSLVASDLVPLQLTLPKAGFKGTPKDIPVSPYTEPMSDKPRPDMLVPAGLQNLAKNSKLSCSDKNADQETLAKIIDGDKDPLDDSIILLRKGLQYVQLDLEVEKELFACVIWHAHNTFKVYRAVIVIVSNDPEFKNGVTQIFNNDQVNSSGLGAGTDREYFETHEGRLINAKGVKARYVRLYSRGSTESALNEYTEVELYGRDPAK